MYGCEIDPDSYQIARHLFPDAHIVLEDIRTYTPDVSFSIIFGNPPYNLNWKYDGHRMTSQAVYLQRAAELLYPGGLLAIIVPQSFLGENSSKADIKRVNKNYNYITQVALDSNAFSWLGVRNFPTKLLILQRRAPSIKHVPFAKELIDEADSNRIYADYILPVLKKTRAISAKIRLDMNRESSGKQEIWRDFRNYLFQIKKHPAIRGQYEEFAALVEQYRTQNRPQDMAYEEWEEMRLHSDPLLKRMHTAIRAQNHVESS